MSSSDIICELFNGAFTGVACPCVLDQTQSCQQAGTSPPPSATSPPQPPLCTAVQTGNYFTDVAYNGIILSLCFTNQFINELNQYASTIGAVIATSIASASLQRLLDVRTIYTVLSRLLSSVKA